MWPWDAAVFAYLCYSCYRHARSREAPGGWAVLVAAGAAVLPDVIDKPLSWQFGVFESGYSLGHSLFFGVPLAVVAYAFARRRGRPRLGTAFGVGVLSHDVGDALEHGVHEGLWVGLERALWPLYRFPGGDRGGFSAVTLRYFSAYLHDVVTLRPTPYLLLVGAVACVVVPLWLYDGRPGLRELWWLLAYPVRARRR